MSSAPRTAQLQHQHNATQQQIQQHHHQDKARTTKN